MKHLKLQVIDKIITSEIKISLVKDTSDKNTSDEV
jgi:hypothetical protein